MHAPMRSFSNLADFLHPLSASPNDTLIDGQKEQGIKPPNQKAAENPLRLPSPQPQACKAVPPGSASNVNLSSACNEEWGSADDRGRAAATR